MPAAEAVAGRVALRPASEGDVAAIAALLAEPSVAPWWGSYDAERVRSELDGTFAVLVGGDVAGWLQAHEETDPGYPSVAFDIALAGWAQDRRVGREALRLAVERFAGRGHHRFTIDPAVDNGRAIRCYAAAGFSPVGVMHAYERAPDGSWRDGLLMELVLPPSPPAS